MEHLGRVVRVQHELRTGDPETDPGVRQPGPHQRGSHLRGTPGSEEVLQPGLRTSLDQLLCIIENIMYLSTKQATLIRR
jgi:hypothetical protein